MKFWQKAFICIIALFLIGVDLIGFALTRHSYSLVYENTCRTALMEERGIESSIYTSIALSLRQYENLNAENLRTTIMPYSDYYKTQGVYLSVYQNGEEQFSSFPGNFDYAGYKDKISPNTARTVTIGGRLYCIIFSVPDSQYHDLQIVYIKDVQSLTDFRQQITRSTILICTAVSVILSGILLFLLVGLTRPFRKLNAAAAEISNGNYDRRVDIHSRDEIGEFAASFNVMADSVETKITEMTAVNEMKEAFINNLSHEMRTPITAILGYAELLSIGNCSEEEKTAAIDYIIAQGGRMRSMSEKLMNLADLSGNPAAKQLVQWETVLSSASLTCAPLQREKGIRLVTQIDAPFVMGDTALLESLVQNLLENAMKALQTGGFVKLRTYLESGVVLEIADDGKGMDEKEIANITEPFYRVDKSRSRAEGGVGLGLSICMRICEAHGAVMRFQSEPGKGTTVKVIFTDKADGKEGNDAR